MIELNCMICLIYLLQNETIAETLESLQSFLFVYHLHAVESEALLRREEERKEQKLFSSEFKLSERK